MPIDQIESRVLAKAESQKAITERAAARDGESLLEAARAAADGYLRREDAKRKKSVDQLKRNLIAKAEMAGRDRLLEVKQGLVDEAFRAAAGRLEAMPEPDYERLAAAMIEGAVRGKEEIIFDQADIPARADRILVEVNKRLEADGRAGVTRGPARRAIGRGFIVRAGRIEDNYSFSELLMMVRTNYGERVADMILGTTA